jgi:hypothetical protein
MPQCAGLPSNSLQNCRLAEFEQKIKGCQGSKTIIEIQIDRHALHAFVCDQPAHEQAGVVCKALQGLIQGGALKVPAPLPSNSLSCSLG